MLFLSLTVILNIFILILFRYLSHFSVNTFQTIVVNYFVCVITGLVFTGSFNPLSTLWFESWLWIAIALGVVFVTCFFLIAKVTQIYGVSIASLASKVSLAIPVAVSLTVFKTQLKIFDLINYSGLILTFVAIILAGIRKEDGVHISKDRSLLILPILVFLFSGLIDTSMNFVNIYYLQPGEENAFSIALFLSAAVSGSVIFLFLNQKPDPKSIPWGIALGMINFFTIVFLLKTLRFFGNDGAFTFPIINIGIIILSTILSRILFKESLSRYQILGIVLGILSLLFISYQEILSGIRYQ